MWSGLLLLSWQSCLWKIYFFWLGNFRPQSSQEKHGTLESNEITPFCSGCKSEYLRRFLLLISRFESSSIMLFGDLNQKDLRWDKVTDEENIKWMKKVVISAKKWNKKLELQINKARKSWVPRQTLEKKQLNKKVFVQNCITWLFLSMKQDSGCHNILKEHTINVIKWLAAKNSYPRQWRSIWTCWSLCQSIGWCSKEVRFKEPETNSCSRILVYDVNSLLVMFMNKE